MLDIYLEKMEPTKSFRDYFLFVVFFPNILSGPIDRAINFLPQINKTYSLTRKEIAMGLMLIMMGLIKKIMIADTRKYKIEDILPDIEEMLNVLKNHNNFEVVGLMKKILPEFISKNSVYEVLDD